MSKSDIKSINNIRNEKNVMIKMNIKDFNNETIEKSESWIRYKIKKAIYSSAVMKVYKRIEQNFLGKLKLYEWKHTRKQMIDSVS